MNLQDLLRPPTEEEVAARQIRSKAQVGITVEAVDLLRLITVTEDHELLNGEDDLTTWSNEKLARIEIGLTVLIPFIKRVKSGVKKERAERVVSEYITTHKLVPLDPSAH